MIKEKVIEETCAIHGREQKCMFSSKKLKGRKIFEYLQVREMIINLKKI